MATKKLFSNKSSAKKVVVKATDTVNNAGGIAYSLTDKAALAQLAMTGCFNGTYYVSDEDQLKKTLELANKVETKFLAQLAVYARQHGLMKDMPAVLAAVLANRDVKLLEKVFPKVIDNPKMLRNFVQVIRSGATGRKSFGTCAKRLIQNYLNSLTDEQLFRADVGNSPSLQDIIKMIHPKPTNKKREALYGYLLDRKYDKRHLCALAKQFESFKEKLKGEIPDVPFQMLTALPLTDHHWKQIAENATWNQIRMNLNTFQRHNVFKGDAELLNSLCQKLQDPEQVKKAKVFPYQLYTAFLNVNAEVPAKVSLALQKAADAALANIPEFDGKVCVMVDTSGSMNSPITGSRGTATTKMRCIDGAALAASAILRKNPDAEIIPFDTKVHQHRLNPLDSVMTNAQILGGFGGGGTDCASALKYLNSKNDKSTILIMVSDNESWITDRPYYSYFGNSNAATEMATQWKLYKKRNPKAKLICWDFTPNTTTQVNAQNDVLNLGGFSDMCFDVIAKFVEAGHDGNMWIKIIQDVKL